MIVSEMVIEVCTENEWDPIIAFHGQWLAPFQVCLRIHTFVQRDHLTVIKLPAVSLYKTTAEVGGADGREELRRKEEK